MKMAVWASSGGKSMSSIRNRCKKFKEAYPDLPKNDWVDAFVIADHLRFGRIAKEVYMDDYRYQALQNPYAGPDLMSFRI